MNVIIVGCGKMGKYLCEILSKEKHNITVIDIKEEVLNKLNNNADVSTLHGNALVIDTLLEANAKNTDILISTMKNDEENVFCCLLAKKLGVKSTIARTRNPEYMKSIEYIKKELGLSMVINPELLTAREISSSIRLPQNINATPLAKGKVELIELKINKDSILNNKSTKEINSYFKEQLLFIAIKRDNSVYVPDGNFILKENDKILISSTPKKTIKFFKKIKKNYLKVNNVMIIGGSKVSYYLAKLLDNLNINVKIIEQNIEKCKLLSEKLENAIIISGDGSDKSLLIEEGIETTDTFVACTGIDEENVVFSMFANSLGIEKIITKVNHLNFNEILEDIGINSTLTPHVIASNLILRYIRSKENSKGGSMETLIRLFDNKLEIMEFKINSDFKKIGKELKNIKFKKNLIIMCINRKDKIIFPTGDDTIQENDRIFISTTVKGIKGLNDILG